MQRALARQAAIEKNLSKYLHLACGHLQTYESFEVYRFAAKSGFTYCEECDDVMQIVKPPKQPPLPETPLFLWLSRLVRGAPRKDVRQELYALTG
jgi:hypothetical protein